MPSILIQGLTDDEKKELDIKKAEKGFDSWKEMMLKLARKK